MQNPARWHIYVLLHQIWRETMPTVVFGKKLLRKGYNWPGCNAEDLSLTLAFNLRYSLSGCILATFSESPRDDPRQPSRHCCNLEKMRAVLLQRWDQCNRRRDGRIQEWNHPFAFSNVMRNTIFNVYLEVRETIQAMRLRRPMECMEDEPSIVVTMFNV